MRKVLVFVVENWLIALAIGLAFIVPMALWATSVVQEDRATVIRRETTLAGNRQLTDTVIDEAARTGNSDGQ